MLRPSSRWRPGAFALLVLGCAAACSNQAFLPPQIDTVLPSEAPNTSSVELTVTGQSFYARLTSDLGNGQLVTEDHFDCVLEHQTLGEQVQAEDVVWIDTGGIQATVPAAIPVGVYDVTVVGPYGRSNTLVGAYEACADPDEDGLCGSIQPTDPWAPTLDSWTYRKRIVVPSRLPATTLIDFPLLISLVDGDLRDRALGSGFDIRFTDDEGAPLEQQLERYDTASGTLVAWVELPSLDTTVDTVLYMYYGGPSDAVDPSVTTVWSNGFIGVWHLDEAGTGAAAEHVDASGNGNDLTGGGGSAAATPSRVDAQIGRGQDFDGADDFLTSSASLLDDLSAMTVTMWAFVRRDDNTTRPGLAGQNDVLEMGFFWNDRLNVWAENMTVNCPGKPIISLCTPDYPLNAWFHLGVSLGGAEIALYLDGVEKHRVPLAALGASAFSFDIGGNVFDPTGNNLDGMVDEVRLATTARSPEWFTVEHANQADPAAFMTVGPEEAHP